MRKLSKWTNLTGTLIVFGSGGSRMMPFLIFSVSAMNTLCPAESIRGVAHLVEKHFEHPHLHPSVC